MKLFSVTLLIIHKNMDPKEITDNLFITPNITHKAGDLIIGKRSVSQSNTYSCSLWSNIIEYDNDCSASDELNMYIYNISKHKEYFMILINKGAIIDIIFRPKLKCSIGVTIKNTNLKLLADIGINFGFEYFKNI